LCVSNTFPQESDSEVLTPDTDLQPGSSPSNYWNWRKWCASEFCF